MKLELYKKHKSITKYGWRKIGMKFTDEEFEYIYGVYISTENCMLCEKEFTNLRDRCLDHDHTTGKFRYILCNKCNAGYDRKLTSKNTSGVRYLHETTKKGYEYYQFKHYPTKFEKCFNKTKYSKEYVIQYIDDYVKNQKI